MGVGAGLYMYVVVVQKFTFAISSPDEFLFHGRFELSRRVEIARTCSKLVAERFEAKFHYAVWSQTGPKLVADLSQTC